jgi:hypothetical protein
MKKICYVVGSRVGEDYKDISIVVFNILQAEI